MYNYAYNPYTGRVEYSRVSMTYAQPFGQANNLELGSTVSDIRESIKGIVSVVGSILGVPFHAIARLEKDITDVILPIFGSGLFELTMYPLASVLRAILKPVYGDIADAVADEFDRRYRVQRVRVTQLGGIR